MPGLIAILDKENRRRELERSLWTIDYLSNCKTKIAESKNAVMAAAWLKNDLIGNDRYFENDRFICLLAGDLIGFQNVPWGDITQNIAEAKYSNLRSLKGVFAISIFDKKENNLHAISDRRSQYPLFYSQTESGIVFSTALSTFCQGSLKKPFNPEWLYEFLYFNYPVLRMTPLKNVFRISPASVLCFNRNTGQCLIHEYAPLFRRAEKLLYGKEAIEKTKSVFQNRMAQYIPPNSKIAVSLTGGLDSRTVLAYSMKLAKNNIETYTYGIPGCSDLKIASSIAAALKIYHHQINFDDDSVNQLGNLIYDTMYLSGGLERITRSTLSYVYKTLTNNGDEFPIILTGIAGDHLFRDHVKSLGNIPFLISADMATTIRNGSPHVNEPLFQKAFRGDYNVFKDYIWYSLDRLADTYGSLNEPASYMSFLIYEISPKHWVGEHAIAGNYSTLRTPYWDDEIISLVYEISFGTIGFSESFPLKDKYLEAVLQANLIRTNRELDNLNIRGIPIYGYSINNKLIYYLLKILWRGPSKITSYIKKYSETPLEDWKNWIKNPLGKEIDRIFSRNALIFNYISPEMIEYAKQMDDEHWLGKFVTVEILLKLIHNGWILEKARGEDITD